MQTRDTRFTLDVLRQAGLRLDSSKAHVIHEHFGLGEGRMGLAIVIDLGWDAPAVEEYVEHMIPQLCGLYNLNPEFPPITRALSTAIIDGLLLGAIAADITYERSMGLCD